MEAPARANSEVQPLTKQQLAGLRMEIRRAGKAARHLRVQVPFVFAGMAIMSLFGNAPIVPLFVAFYLVGVGAAMILASAYRLFCERQFRRRLAQLSAVQRYQVLRPLHGESTGDMPRLVSFLVRELCIPTDLTPAGSPEGSGAEVSGAFRVRPTTGGGEVAGVG